MKEGFEILNKAINSYIIDANLTGVEDLKLMNSLNDIVLNNEEVYFNYKYNKKYSLKESDKIVKDFLMYLNPYYKDYYETRLLDGTIIFDYNNTTEESAYSSYDPIYNKRIIYIPLEQNLEDSFAIVHELMHDINMDISMENISRYFYTEGLSFLSEFLLEDYLQDKNIKQYKNPNNRGLYALKSKAIEVDYNIRLIKTYLKDGYINMGNYINMIESYPCNYLNDLSFVSNKIMDKEELTLDDEQPYILGGLIATYMYDRIKENKNNILELFELNQMLKKYNFDQVLDYLELDYNDIDLNPPSYKKLEDKYKKYLKSR